jgi:hypothetical protein
MGASWGLLMDAPPPAIRDERALWPGFSLIALPALFCWSSFFLRSSSRAAAPVSSAGENLGENAPVYLGDLGDGDAVRPALVMVVALEGFSNCSGLFLFSDLTLEPSILD